MVPRKTLTSILNEADQHILAQAWGDAKAAEDFSPLPPGDYIARIHAGELFKSSRKQTPGYKLTFKISEGEFAGRLIWHDVWLTEAAMSMAKRDLEKLGITSLAQLERPLPPGICVSVKLVLHRDDDGNEANRVKRFTVVGIDPPEADPFAPSGESDGAPC